jgi:bacillithiol synthase
VRPRANAEVVRVLTTQNAPLAASAARDAHLAALARGASVVVTGQQVGLFLGPLYTIYKAATAIVVARALAAERGEPVVPVFWLQTEDHDLAEIAWCGVPSRVACERVAVPIAAENRISIAHLAVPADIAACHDALATLLGDGADAVAHRERLQRHYRAGVPWANAFAGLLAELFAPEGLVVIDPRDPALAALAAPIHARAIEDSGRIAEALIARRDELARAGQATPIHVRAGAPLSFVHSERAQGPRYRLEPTIDGRLAEVGSERVHERSALLALLGRDPLAFSTSALLRPIVQDTLLPTAAYVGGPAEVAYFAQLAPLYELFALPPPRVVPRARFRIVDHRMRALLERVGLASSELQGSEAELLARIRRPAATGDELVRKLLDPFVASHGELAGAADPQLARAFARTRVSVERAVGKLARKVERAALYGDSEVVDAVRRLRARLAPDGAPQERVLGLPGFAVRGGDRALVESVLAAIAAPFDGRLEELA